jgi:hypothetical protein
MPYYYAYHVDDAGHVVSRFDFHAETDQQAVEKARRRQDGMDIEIWELDRKVSVLQRPV